VRPARRERPTPRRSRGKRLSAATFVLRLPGKRVLVVAAALVVLGGLVFAGLGVAARVVTPDLVAGGAAPDAKVGAASLHRLAFWVEADRASARDTEWRLDGADVSRLARLEGGRFVLRPRRLPDGAHTIEALRRGSFPGATARRTWRIALDTTIPRITLERDPLTAAPARPLTVDGTVEVGASVTVNGKRVAVRAGRFTIALDGPPERPLRLAASDPFGNRSSRRVPVALVPRRPPAPVRAVHVTAIAWSDPDLRRGVLQLADEGRIDAVELDLKDEAGIVGFAADVPLARRIGAVQPVYDLRTAIEQLHKRGLQVIGRLVCFRDPIHAAAAWKAGRRNEVVQTPGRGPYSGYGGFTNLADPAVRRYQIDIAVAAAKAGIDDVLYDYVRRPDGPLSSMRFPGLVGTPEAAIVEFLHESRAALRPYDVFLGASVFGVAATRPKEVAQDIPQMARAVDYVAPMVYPSHWGPGEYDVSYPNGQPYDIVNRSLRDFVRQTRNTGARVVPWLQDFTLGVTYGPAEVAAQIRAAHDAGVDEWVLWDPLVTYTADGLERRALGPALATRPMVGAKPKPVKQQSGTSGGSRAAAVHANELGDVPVLMYHQIRADGGGDFDLTPLEFRSELARLYSEGYRPIRAVDLATGRIDVPAGKSPVVLTFDDSTKEQFAYDAAGRIKPDTALGIMEAFARERSDFELAGTFYVNREPFAGVKQGPRMLRYLAEHGFEIGDHTKDHLPFTGLSPTEVQRQLVLGRRIIRAAVPDAPVATMALPLGAQPKPLRLARHGSWGGESYSFAGIFLVGAEPAPSPFSTKFDPAAIPRIRTSPSPRADFGSGFWLDELKHRPGRRYVSDGDPDTIAFPRSRAGELAARFRARARPY
jgi:peptidoglycan/xylan/chitin deacetylase (PgdA/CDA1 family)